MIVFEIIFIIIIKFIKSTIAIIASILFYLGGIILFSFMLAMMTSNMGMRDFISEYGFMFAISLPMVVIGLILQAWLVKTGKRGILRNKIKKFIKKRAKKEN